MLWILLLGVAAAYWFFWLSAPRVEFSSSPLEFPDQLAGGSSEAIVVGLTNVGRRVLRIDTVGVVAADLEDFVTDSEACTMVELMPGNECRVGVRFTPRAPGARSGEMSLAGNMRGRRATLPLVGQAVAPHLSSRPEGLDFGSESVGATSPGRDLELVNEGTARLDIERVTVDPSDGEFRLIRNQCSSAQLGPGEACGVRLVFKPRLLGRRTAELEVASSSFGETAPIVLRGSGSGPDLEIDPPGLVFGSQLVGTRSAVATLTLTNRGDEPFSISRAWIEDASAFTVDKENCSSSSVAPSESCRVAVVFEPKSEGEARSSLQIRESSGGMAPGVGISGHGVSPRLELSQASLDFGAVLVGERAAQQSVRLTNAGSATLEVAEFRVGGEDSVAFPKGRDGCSGVEMAPGEHCDIEIGFYPRHGGGHRARVAVRSNQPGDNPQIELSGHGRAPRMSFDRQRLDFAAVRQSESQDLRVEVTNSGDAPLRIGTVLVGGSAAPDFGVAADACSRTPLAPGAVCRLVVRFSPTANGPRDSRLIVESDASAASVALVLRGVGLPPPVPGILVSPRSLEFSSRSVGNRSEVLTVRISSVGEGRLEIAGIRVAGRDAGDFRVVPGTCQGLPYVVPGGDCTVGVRFVPTVVGSRAGKLVIEHNAEHGSVDIPLRAEGI